MKDKKEIIDTLIEIDGQLETLSESVYSLAKMLYFEGSEDEASDKLRESYQSIMLGLMHLDGAIRALKTNKEERK